MDAAHARDAAPVPTAPSDAPPKAPRDAPDPNAVRRRDAARTRRLLLQSARDRFATQGYAATTVRQIADDAGVNAALISRYFRSKEGLFEECLAGVSTELGSAASASTLDEVAVRMAQQLTRPGIAGHPHQLALLLRSSGDERAERIRFDTLRTYAERLADVALAASGADAASTREHFVLRAQLALSSSIGIALLRSMTALEPLASADDSDLVAPLKALVRALLDPEGDQGDR